MEKLLRNKTAILVFVAPALILFTAILLVPKIWDAVNDTLFGYIVDKTRFRNREKFLPWIRIGTALFGPAVILLFAIPRSLNSQIVKIAWFLIAYVIFDAAYTMLDAPVYALPTAMTTNIAERTRLISSNRFSGIFGGALATVITSKLTNKNAMRFIFYFPDFPIRSTCSRMT